MTQKINSLLLSRKIEMDKYFIRDAQGSTILLDSSNVYWTTGLEPLTALTREQSAEYFTVATDALYHRIIATESGKLIEVWGKEVFNIKPNFSDESGQIIQFIIENIKRYKLPRCTVVIHADIPTIVSAAMIYPKSIITMSATTETLTIPHSYTPLTCLNLLHPRP